jgi:hypothetical protein
MSGLTLPVCNLRRKTTLQAPVSTEAALLAALAQGWRWAGSFGLADRSGAAAGPPSYARYAEKSRRWGWLSDGSTHYSRGWLVTAVDVILLGAS